MSMNRKPFVSLFPYLTKGRLLWALGQTRSLTEASKLCEVSYITFRKYAKLYRNDDGLSLFDEYKNQEGRGIPKPKLNRSKKNDLRKMI